MLPRIAPLSTASVALCALLTGCAAPVESSALGALDDGTPTTVHGFLSVEQSAAWGQDSEGTRQTAAATFLRVQDGTDPQLMARMVGAVADLPGPGKCRVEGQSEGSSLPLRMLNPIEMVPVGEVLVRAGDSSTRLVARAYPDVAHLVSGVVYTSSGREQPMKPVAGENLVTFEVAGGEGVPGFEVAVPTPAPIEKLYIEQDEEAGRQSPLAVTWQASTEQVAVPAEVGVLEGADQFFVDLVLGREPGEVTGGDLDAQARRAPRTVRCGGGASATIVVPAAMRGDRALTSVAVHRLRTIRLTTPALTGGQVRVDVQRLLSLPEPRSDEATR